MSGRKPELDAISVASEASQDDKCSTSVSENDSETQSVSSFSSGPSLRYPTTDQIPTAVRSGSLDLPGPVSIRVRDDVPSAGRMQQDLFPQV